MWYRVTEMWGLGKKKNISPFDLAPIHSISAVAMALSPPPPPRKRTETLAGRCPLIEWNQKKKGYRVSQK